MKITSESNLRNLPTFLFILVFYSFLRKLLQNYSASPNTIIYSRHVAAIHLVIGSDNEDFAEKATLLMLKHGGDPNLEAEDAMTPLHIAAHMGRAKIVGMLLVSI